VFSFKPLQHNLFFSTALRIDQASLEVAEVDKAALWWAGKEMIRGKTLGDFIGKNEKTKVVCKLQKVSQKTLSLSFVCSHLEFDDN